VQRSKRDFCAHADLVVALLLGMNGIHLARLDARCRFALAVTVRILTLEPDGQIDGHHFLAADVGSLSVLAPSARAALAREASVEWTDADQCAQTANHLDFSDHYLAPFLLRRAVRSQRHVNIDHLVFRDDVQCTAVEGHFRADFLVASSVVRQLEAFGNHYVATKLDCPLSARRWRRRVGAGAVLRRVVRVAGIFLFAAITWFWFGFVVARFRLWLRLRRQAFALVVVCVVC